MVRKVARFCNFISMHRSLSLLLLLLITTGIRAQTTSGSTLSDQEVQQTLDYHNRVRKEVGSPPLQWSPELATYAQAWADHLVAIGCEMQHRPFDGEWKQLYGENIFWGSDASFTVENACGSWYGEIKDYRYGVLNENNWYKTGHYTQMVWKNTTHVGLGKAVCPNGAVIIVGNYNPPGNYLGQKPY